MRCYPEMPYLKCGDVFKNTKSDELKRYEKPINLAWVEVDVKNIYEPKVLINYSQNLEFELLDFNPEFIIKYRLVRRSNCTNDIDILEYWTYKVSEVIPSNIQPINTIEPLVLNYCDSLDNICETSFTYIIQLVEIIYENARFNITNKELAAIVNHGINRSDYLL